MIYPSYATVLSRAHTEEALGVLQTLDRLYIKDLPAVFCTFYVDGNQHRAYRTTNIPEGIELLSPFDFIKVYKDFQLKLQEFLINLEIGSKVTLDKRHLDGSDYPLTYTGDMEKFYAEKEFIIEKIEPVSSYDIDINKKPAYNGDNRVFFLKGIPDYIFHSSMFSITPIKPIKTIELSSLNINLLDF